MEKRCACGSILYTIQGRQIKFGDVKVTPYKGIAEGFMECSHCHESTPYKLEIAGHVDSRGIQVVSEIK